MTMKMPSELHSYLEELTVFISAKQTCCQVFPEAYQTRNVSNYSICDVELLLTPLLKT